MATEEVEYESDPEETKMSLKMRRRVASDDEDEVEGRVKPVRRIDSDVESDGQGAAPAEYDDEEDEEVEDEATEEYLEEEEEELEEGIKEPGLVHSQVVVDTVVEGKGGNEWGEEESTEVEGVIENGDGDGDGTNDLQQKDGEEKKENEPYAVPTAGAFYMHDDRFRENVAGRNRRTLSGGGRKLWESKDERKWGHDKFEELTFRENQYDEGRRSSRGGRFRGRGRSRGAGPQGNRPKNYENDNDQNNNNDQNNAPKSVRGRGPKRYQPRPPTQNKQSGKFVEKGSRTSSVNSDVESTGKTQVSFASSLNSASPPFYPSSSSSSNPKRDGKNMVDSVGMDKLYIDDGVGRKSHNFRGGQGRGVFNNSGQSRGGQGYSRQYVERPGSAPEVSSPAPKVGVSESESPKSNTGKVNVQGGSGSGRSPFLYEGAQVNMNAGHGDQKFPSTPTFLPVMQLGGQQVMQLGGQHPGGIPAVGMAFPGYVGNPQLGMGNSEMTWLPVLAGAAGALGATYCSPYGAYLGQPSTALTTATSKESNTNKPNDDGKSSSQRPATAEHTNDEFGQRHKNPRRYTEMKFDQ